MSLPQPSEKDRFVLAFLLSTLTAVLVAAPFYVAMQRQNEIPLNRDTTITTEPPPELNSDEIETGRIDEVLPPETNRSEPATTARQSTTSTRPTPTTKPKEPPTTTTSTTVAEKTTTTAEATTTTSTTVKLSPGSGAGVE